MNTLGRAASIWKYEFYILNIKTADELLRSRELLGRGSLPEAIARKAANAAIPMMVRNGLFKGLACKRLTSALSSLAMPTFSLTPSAARATLAED